jgi:hypothetical protein
MPYTPHAPQKLSHFIFVFLLFCALTVLIPQIAAAQLADSAWPMFRHDLQHTGQSPFAGPNTPKEKWTFQTEAYVNSSPSLASDGTIYLGASHKLHAINPDGTLK